MTAHAFLSLKFNVSVMYLWDYKQYYWLVNKSNVEFLDHNYFNF